MNYTIVIIIAIWFALAVEVGEIYLNNSIATAQQGMIVELLSSLVAVSSIYVIERYTLSPWMQLWISLTIVGIMALAPVAFLSKLPTGALKNAVITGHLTLYLLLLSALPLLSHIVQAKCGYLIVGSTMSAVILARACGIGTISGKISIGLIILSLGVFVLILSPFYGDIVFRTVGFILILVGAFWNGRERK